VTLAARLTGKTVAETISAMLAVFGRIDPHLRRSITLDNDPAFGQHRLLSTMHDMTTWFCDAYASRQKGGVENANPTRSAKAKQQSLRNVFRQTLRSGSSGPLIATMTATVTSLMNKAVRSNRCLPVCRDGTKLISGLIYRNAASIHGVMPNRAAVCLIFSHTNSKVVSDGGTGQNRDTRSKANSNCRFDNTAHKFLLVHVL
jgi:hypothetical protein